MPFDRRWLISFMSIVLMIRLTKDYKNSSGRIRKTDFFFVWQIPIRYNRNQLTQWVVSSSWTVFMNKNSGRIRTLSWYLIIAYQSHNLCYGKSQIRIIRDFLFGGLRKVLNSLTSRFLRVSCRYLLYITIHDATKSRIICLTKT